MQQEQAKVSVTLTSVGGEYMHAVSGYSDFKVACVHNQTWSTAELCKDHVLP